jgi:hypothetical protein
MFHKKGGKLNMKKFLFLSIAFLFIACQSTTSTDITEAVEIDWKDAPKYIGKTVIVCGPIIDTSEYQGITILGLGVGVMEPGAVGIEIPGSLVKQLPAGKYVGKTICVTGKVHTNPAGGGSISIKDLSQIEAK